MSPSSGSSSAGASVHRQSQELQKLIRPTVRNQIREQKNTNLEFPNFLCHPVPVVLSFVIHPGLQFCFFPISDASEGV